MASRAVSLREALAIRRGQQSLVPGIVLPGRWKPVHALPAPACCGVSVARFDPSCADGQQYCEGQVVIQPFCPPPAPPTEDDRRRAEVTKDAIVAALGESPPIVVQPSPLQHPGYRGKRQTLTRTVVVHGDDPIGLATGAQLLALNLGATGVVTSTVVPTNLFQFPVPSGDSCQVERLRIHCDVQQGWENLFFQVMRSGTVMLPEVQQRPFEGFDLQFPAEGDQVVVVTGRISSPIMAFLVHFMLDAWTFPVPTQTDGLYTRVLRQNPGWPQRAELPCEGRG
jgi:hypothetical protein